MTTSILPAAGNSGNDRPENTLHLPTQFLHLPDAALPSGEVVALTCSDNLSPIQPKAGDHLIIHVEPYSPECPRRWAVRIDGEVHDVELWLRLAIDNLPEQLLVMPPGKQPMFPISEEQVIGRIVGVVEQSLTTTTSDTLPVSDKSDRCNQDAASPEWMTIDQAIDFLNIRAWIALELCGSTEIEGWKVSPHHVAKLREALCHFPLYRDVFCETPKRSGTPLPKLKLLSELDKQELRNTEMENCDLAAFIRINLEKDGITPGTHAVVLCSEDGLCIDAPVQSPDTYAGGWTELIGEVIAYHTPQETTDEKG